MDKKRVVVIGGGAAGFFAAINCAEANPQRQVIILEGTRRVLTKVRISGGGRCNVTHACFDPMKLVGNYPRGTRELRGPFSRFQAQDTVAWFERRGVKLKTERDGRMFSVTDSSQTIIDCLLKAANDAGVQLQLGRKVTAITRTTETAPLTVHTVNGEPLTADYVLLATGSAPIGYELATSLGHHIVSPVPSLFTFKVQDERLVALAGVAVEQVALSLSFPKPTKIKYRQNGPLLVTHWGVSGPAVLKLSAWGARELHEHGYHASLVVNWLPQLSATQVDELLQLTKSKDAKKSLYNACPVPLPKRLWHYFLAKLAVDDTHVWGQASKKLTEQLLVSLTAFELLVSGKGEFKEEFVTAGGVELKEVDFKSMESKLCRGLYFAGEILNIDGITGGFNFQNAWTGGWLAAQSMAREAQPVPIA